MTHMMFREAPNELNFCVPFATDAEANAAREWLRSNLLPLMTTVFGSEVSDIWRRFLAGGAVVRRTYDDPNSEIVRGFVNDGETISDADRVVAEAWAGVMALGVQPGDVRTVPLSSVLRSTRRAINYRNPISIPGNIAGGEGFGDGGIDTRTVGGSVVVSRSPPASGGWFQRWNHRDITSAQFSLEYTIDDTVDFCPGDPARRSSRGSRCRSAAWRRPGRSGQSTCRSPSASRSTVTPTTGTRSPTPTSTVRP